MIWLRAYREQKEKNELELEEVKLKTTFELEKQHRMMLADIRYLCMLNIGISNESDALRIWYSLPSLADEKNKKKIVGRSRKIPKE